MNDPAGCRVEVQRVCRDAVVHGEGGLGRAVEFVRHDVLSRRQFRDRGHAGSEGVVGVGDVVDGGGPGVEVGAGLVDELLAVEGVALVRVVDDELIIVR